MSLAGLILLLPCMVITHEQQKELVSEGTSIVAIAAGAVS